MKKSANPADAVEHCMTDKFPAYKAVPLAGLIPYARNSRTHSDAQVSKIAASIREFGFLNPVIVDGENGIIAGHGRVMAAQKLGMELVPIIEASHLTDAQRRAYVIADNKLALDAGWDDELLRVEFAELEELGFDLELTGFSLDGIEALQPVDYSILDAMESEEDCEALLDDMEAGVKRAIQIEFEAEDYDEAAELIKHWRSEGAYIGAMIIEALRKGK